ncbi:protein of unknown function [Candidatus Filomicrobium marinum]|uniref:Uncharacterized protein n=1 Tax=Candidatus Filomicrobium marinum TaxID=1608628 RepID=A0A0D6JC52_9HYPH|nr:protein of unknown function [Candidatus Filomicrobium marinum]CPR16255.1 protein of unknown function [Candidatus Filomicrobium marinum]
MFLSVEGDGEET